MVTTVLLKVDLMCAWPAETFLRSLRRGLRVAACRVLGGICGSLSCQVIDPLPAPGGAADNSACGLLLAGHGALGALAGAGVGLGALATHRQAPTVPQALVGADLDLATDIGGNLTAQ